MNIKYGDIVKTQKGVGKVIGVHPALIHDGMTAQIQLDDGSDEWVDTEDIVIINN